MRGQAPTPSPYRGRFAPSPTGPLHFGSLLAAVASYADARAAGGSWLVRIDDLDHIREVPGAAQHILDTLVAFGFIWDGPVLYQRDRTPAYAEALERLIARGLAYPCGCSRAEIARQGLPGRDGPRYPGTCRQGLSPQRKARTMRIRVDDTPIHLDDAIQGAQRAQLATSVGDFVLRRADGIHAYQLAVVVDDAWQAITHIVRGADLLPSTPRQIHLQRQLGLPTPSYAHIPVAITTDGRKLSKSLGSAPVDPQDPLPALRLAWQFLSQAALGTTATPERFWQTAIAHWDLSRVPACPSIQIGPGP